MQAKLIAVPAMHGQENISGIIAFWKLGGAVVYQSLADEWEQLGLDNKLLPAPVSKSNALRRTLATFRDPHVLVRPLQNVVEGYVLVTEMYGSDGMPEYTNGMSVRLIDGEPHVDGTDDAATSKQVRATFNHQLNTLTQQDVSVWLVDLVRSVQAVRLRETGGIYFIPRNTLATWRAYVAAIRAASSAKVYEIPSLQSDEAVVAVLDAVTREAEEASEEMAQQLDAIGELSERQRATRMEHIERVEAKVATYEQLFGVRLNALHEQFELLQSRICASALAASAIDYVPPAE